jgi:hypothetical protein
MATATATAPADPYERRWYPFRPHATQFALWSTPARFVSVQAGRRSGKTELAKRRLVRYLPVPIPGCPQPRYAFGAPTHAQAKEIAWQDLLDLIPDRWIRGGKNGPNVSYSTLTIDTIFGSSLRVFGLDKPYRVEGSYLNGVGLDESSDIRPGAFDRVIRPMLSDYGGWAWRVGVPKRQGIGAAEFNAFHDSCEAGEYLDGAAFWWASADILLPEEIKAARETLDPKDFREQFEARRETAGGQIFYAFHRDFNVRPCPYTPGRAIVVGSDFNVDPMAWVLGHNYSSSQGNRVEWFDEIWLRNSNTQAALDVLWARYSNHTGGWQFYGDAASKQRKTSAHTTDYVQIFNDPRFTRAGRTVHYPEANPPTADRFAATNAMFCNADGVHRMFVDPRCKRLIQDLEGRYYKPGTREAADSGDLSHATDALGYVVYRLFPLRIETTAQRRIVVTTG